MSSLFFIRVHYLCVNLTGINQSRKDTVINKNYTSHEQKLILNDLKKTNQVLFLQTILSWIKLLLGDYVFTLLMIETIDCDLKRKQMIICTEIEFKLLLKVFNVLVTKCKKARLHSCCIINASLNILPTENLL